MTLRMGPVQSTSSVPFFGIDIIGACCAIVNEGRKGNGLRRLDALGVLSSAVSKRLTEDGSQGLPQRSRRLAGRGNGPIGPQSCPFISMSFLVGTISGALAAGGVCGVLS